MITSEKILNKIEAALDEIRPYLKKDGADIDLIEVSDDYVVKLNCLALVNLVTLV